MSIERIGAARLRGLEGRLSSRDHNLLRLLNEHRFLMTGQLSRLLFADHASPPAGIRACVRVLGRLRHLGLVDRLRRRIGGVDAGSRGFVWYLAAPGDRLLRHIDGEDVPHRRRYFEPSLTFLEHTLAVADVRVALQDAARTGTVVLKTVQTEPAAWRRYVDEYGRPAILKPDLFAVTVLGEFQDHWVFEIDRGTESLRTLLGKCAQYEAYRRTGHEQEQTGVFPLVVWLIPDERRRRRLASEIARSPSLEPALYRIAAPESVTGLVTGVSPPLEPESALDSTDFTKGGTHE